MSLVSKYLQSILENIIKIDINSNIFFNINFPNINFKELKGCKVVKAGKENLVKFLKLLNQNLIISICTFLQKEKYIRQLLQMRMNMS